MKFVYIDKRRWKFDQKNANKTKILPFVGAGWHQTKKLALKVLKTIKRIMMNKANVNTYKSIWPKLIKVCLCKYLWKREVSTAWIVNQNAVWWLFAKCYMVKPNRKYASQRLKAQSHRNEAIYRNNGRSFVASLCDA